MNRVTNKNDFPLTPPPPPQRQPTSWADAPPQDGREQWHHLRRQEILNAAGPLAMALVRANDLQGTAGDEREPWKQDAPDQARLDVEAAERAVRIAAALQAAADRARPRS